jgi:hypothetical protein
LNCTAKRETGVCNNKEISGQGKKNILKSSIYIKGPLRYRSRYLDSEKVGKRTVD